MRHEWARGTQGTGVLHHLVDDTGHARCNGRMSLNSSYRTEVSGERKCGRCRKIARMDEARQRIADAFGGVS